MNLERWISSVYIEERNNVVNIKTPNTFDFISDITKKWNSSKITNNIFTKQTKKEVEFELFFAVEIYYIVTKLLEWKINSRVLDNPNMRYVRTPASVLKSIKVELENKTWLNSIFGSNKNIITNRLDLNKINDMVFKPLDYQENFISYYNQHLDQYHLKGSLLFSSPGTGKTYTSLTVANCLGNSIDHVIVLSPNNALDRVWRKSLEYGNSGCLFKERQSFWISNSNISYTNEKYIIVNYEYLNKLMDLVKALKNKRFMIILDESHNFNEISSLRTQLFIDLCRTTKSENIILMSGTPIKALGRETIPLFSAIDPFFTPKVEERFKSIYGLTKNVAADILSYRLGLVTFKVEKAVLNLAPPIHKEVKIKIPNGDEFTLEVIKEKMTQYINEREKYYSEKSKEDKERFFSILNIYKDTLKTKENINEFNKYLSMLEMIRQADKMHDLHSVLDIMKIANSYEKHIMSQLSSEDKKEFRELKTIYKYVSLKIQGECLGNVLGKERTRCNVELAKYVDYTQIIDSAEKKTLIFTSFVNVLQEVNDILKNIGYKPLVVYGNTNKELNSIVERFDNDPDINPLVATFQSLSTAVPLTMADNLILLNQPFRDYILNQAISRIHRLNTDTQVFLYDILLDTGDKPNISTRSADILEWSQKQIDDILGVNLDTSISNIEENSLNISNESLGINEYINLNTYSILKEKNKLFTW